MPSGQVAERGSVDVLSEEALHILLANSAADNQSSTGCSEVITNICTSPNGRAISLSCHSGLPDSVVLRCTLQKHLMGGGGGGGGACFFAERDTIRLTQKLNGLDVEEQYFTMHSSYGRENNERDRHHYTLLAGAPSACTTLLPFVASCQR